MAVETAPEGGSRRHQTRLRGSRCARSGVRAGGRCGPAGLSGAVSTAQRTPLPQTPTLV